MRYLDNIIARFKRQEAKGLAKYGQTLEDNQARVIERLEHLAQELTDALMYIEWVMEQIGGRPTTQMENACTYRPLASCYNMNKDKPGYCRECMQNYFCKRRGYYDG